MQPVLAPPRDVGLTGQQVLDVIECANLEVGVGCELLDDADAFIDDVSTDVRQDTGEVRWAADQRLPLGGAISVSRELLWGWQRLKPYMTLRDKKTGISARFNLGVYLMSTSGRPAGESVRTWDVELHDKLAALDVPIGTAYHVAATDNVLATLGALLTAGGEDRTRIVIDGTATFPNDQVWAIDDANTYLSVANEMLALAANEPLWSDWDGWVRSEPLSATATRSPEYTYDADDPTRTIVGVDRVATADFFSVPNVWVFTVANPGALTLPVEGNGIYTVTNASDGPSSIAERRRTIRTVIPLDAVNQASLVAQGDKIVETQKRAISELQITTGPNPLHAHNDVVTINDLELGIAGRCLSSSWSLPFDGSDMTHRLKEV